MYKNVTIFFFKKYSSTSSVYNFFFTRFIFFKIVVTNYINYLINKGCCGTNKKSLCDRIEERGASKSPSSNNRENLKDGSTASVILLAILALIGFRCIERRCPIDF